MKVLCICLVLALIALFYPKKKKGPKLVLHRGGKYDFEEEKLKKYD